MFSEKLRQFLFKCEDCELILTAGFDDPEDIDKINDNKIELECPCKGVCKILRN